MQVPILSEKHTSDNPPKERGVGESVDLFWQVKGTSET